MLSDFTKEGADVFSEPDVFSMQALTQPFSAVPDQEGDMCFNYGIVCPAHVKSRFRLSVARLPLLWWDHLRFWGKARRHSTGQPERAIIGS